MTNQKSPSKAERREAAREQARKLREAQARREKRNRVLIITGAVVLIIAVAVAAFFIVQQGTRSVIADVENVPANSDVEDGGISIGSDMAAGTENEGAPVLNVYLDFACPHCADFEQINAEDIDQMVADGEVTAVYHPVSLLSRGDRQSWSWRAAEAAAVVADQAPEQYNAFQTALFELYAQSGGQTQPSDEQIVQAARDAGVPQDVAQTIPQQTFDEWVDATTRQFSRDGFEGTPTVLVDGEEFQNWSEPGALADAVGGE